MTPSMSPTPPARRLRLATAATTAAVLTAALAGCGAEDDAPDAAARSTAAASPSETAEAAVPTPSAPAPSPTAPSAAPVADLDSPAVVARGLEAPWGMAFLPDGDALVAERDAGRVLRLSPGGGEPQVVREVPGVVPNGEGGLLGLAVASTFAQDSLVYAYLTTGQDNRVVRFPLDDPDAEPEVVLTGIDAASYHNGGRIAFGPDGMLYVGTGDAGVTGAAQDPDSPNGKILRITPDGEPAPGNPTAGSPVWSSGHRNVQGLAWDAEGRLLATEFGQDEVDELNLIEPGGNYGWPEVEGAGGAGNGGGGGRFTDPLVTWPVADASPSGLAVVGTTAYLAALRGERLWTVPLQGEGVGRPVAELQGELGRLRTVAVAPDGALWLTTSNTDGRGDPGEADDRVLRYPVG